MNERALDPDCLRYLEHWEPVLTAPAQRTLERFESEPASLLDLGAGTGLLTLAAAALWPAGKIVALDASAAMLAVARWRMADADATRVEWLTADAADIPLDDASVDAVASSFVLQLVADRPAVLAEVLRVLRPGGTFAFVTWLGDDLVLPADAAYHDVLGDIDGDDQDDGFRSPRSGDYDSAEQAGDELAGAGFLDVEVAREEFHHAWTVESYLAFKLAYDDYERIVSLAPARRATLEAALVQRLATLPPEAFEVRGPLVAGVARRPRA